MLGYCLPNHRHDMAKTYVLAGYDDPGKPVFADGLKSLEGQDDVVIVRAQPGQSMAQAIRAQNIAAGDNIVIATHGTKTGGLEWNKGEILPYGEAFKHLPEGIRNIAVTSCYGEMAQRDLQFVPKGALLQTLVGTEMVNISTSITQFAKETRGETSPAIIMIEALDNVDPNEVAKVAAEHNAKNGTHFETDPNKVLPHTIGIGGKPPEPLNLSDKLDNMSNAGKAGKLNMHAMQEATAMVIERFDTTRFNYQTKQQESGGMIAEASLDVRIIGVAAKINAGAPLESIEEKRIGYALAIAYLDKSGELETMVQKARGESQPHAPAQAPAQTERPDVTTVQNFLNDVGMKGLNGKPLATDGVVGDNTRHAFVQFCEQNDLDPAKGVDEKFQATMQRYQAAFKSGALTKQEAIDIRQSHEVLRDITKGMSPQQLSAIRSEFADMRNAMMGNGNDTQVKEEIGQLVAVTKQAMVEQDSARGRV